MIKKEIIYVNPFTEEEITKTFLFHLNKHDMIRIVGRAGKSWDEYVKEVMDSKDSDRILDLIEEVIKTSVGEKGEDGVSFIKDKQYQNSFVNSEAYAELIASFIIDEGSIEPFFKGVVGKGGVAPKEAAKNSKKK